VALDRPLAAAARDLRGALPELADQLFHQPAPVHERVGVALDLRRKKRHDETLQSRDAVR
jgi:hypothetical protein